MTTLVATFGTKFDYVVGSGDDIWVVFHDYDRVTFVQKGIEGVEQFADIIEVEAGSGLIEYE